MKVAYVTHLMAKTLSGGAERQMLKTRQTINGLGAGFEVSLFNPWEHELSDFDIVHIFNPRAFPMQAANMALLCQESGVKVALSPIFFHFSGIPVGRRSAVERIWEKVSEDYRRLLLGKTFSSIDPYRIIRQVIANADILLPNTAEEARSLQRFFAVQPGKCHIVPNAADSSFTNGNVDLFVDEFGFKDFILFSGRIEPQKNVIGLIRAFNIAKLPTKLVLIGKRTSHEYFLQCEAEVKGDVIFLDPLPFDSKMLHSLYKAAKVIALPSYYETPGLVALEGGLAGANVVITKNGGTKEYFSDLARYVDPLDIEGIAAALEQAFHQPRTDALRDHILRNFTWEKVAEKTLEAYRLLV